MPKKQDIGVWVIRLLVAIPVVIWVFMKPLSIRFADSMATVTSLGQIAGLAGMTAFAITLILSARFKFIESYFGGYDRVYSVHHTLGVYSFVLLLAHPLFLAAQYAHISIVDAARLLLPGTSWAIDFGIYSLILMIIVLVITMFARKIPYQFLKTIHKTFGFIFFLGGLHVFLIPSDVSQNMLLRWYILGFAVAALLAYAYRTLFGKWMVKKFVYEVVQVNTPADSVTEIVMKPMGKPMNYLPGQFVFLSLDDPELSREIHPFSVSSAPHEEYLRITIKALGDYTSLINQLPVGTQAFVEGPFGHFTYHRHQNKNQIWIAGGVGVTPFLSMARDLAARTPEGFTVDFYYTVKNRAEALFYDEVLATTTRYPGFRFIPFYSDDHGFLNAKVVADTSGGVFGKEVLVCGPPIMMKSMTEQLIAGGVASDKIHSEAFRML